MPRASSSARAPLRTSRPERARREGAESGGREARQDAASGEVLRRLSLAIVRSARRSQAHGARQGGRGGASPCDIGLATQWQPPGVHTLTPCRVSADAHQHSPDARRAGVHATAHHRTTRNTHARTHARTHTHNTHTHAARWRGLRARAPRPPARPHLFLAVRRLARVVTRV